MAAESACRGGWVNGGIARAGLRILRTAASHILLNLSVDDEFLGVEFVFQMSFYFGSYLVNETLCRPDHKMLYYPLDLIFSCSHSTTLLKSSLINKANYLYRL